MRALPAELDLVKQISERLFVSKSLWDHANTLKNPRLPNTVGRLTEMTHFFDASGNNLTGALPTELGYWSDMQSLGVEVTRHLLLCAFALILLNLCLNFVSLSRETNFPEASGSSLICS